MRDKVQETLRAAHRTNYEPAWFRFPAETEDSCREERADEYASFLTQHQSSRWLPTVADPERLRLLAFQRHFQLPDFWPWDAEYNNQPFQSCA